MFDPQEIKQLKELFTESANKMIGEIGEVETRMIGKIGESETRMIGKIGESETRMIGRIEKSVKNSEGRMVGKIEESEIRTGLKIDQLSNDLGEFVDNVILPQIAEKADKSDVERMERKLDWLVDKVSEHDIDIKKIKSKVFIN